MATAIALKEPTNPLLDTLLTNVAHKIQLAPSQYAVAVDRYSIMEKWLQRDGSELAPYFKRLYPQGSMAIGATIASKLKNDEFDIDIIAEAFNVMISALTVKLLHDLNPIASTHSP